MAFISRMRNGIITALWLASALPVCADDAHVEPVSRYVESHVRAWIADPVIVRALTEWNDQHAHLTQQQIEDMDATWRNEFAGKDHPLVDSILNNSLSAFLKQKQAASNGVITEIFVIDAKGLSVGESEMTSDYWQGDEAKWQQTYLVGAGVLFVDRAERDDSTQVVQSQASMTISDPRTGQPIGCITVGIDLGAL